MKTIDLVQVKINNCLWRGKNLASIRDEISCEIPKLGKIKYEHKEKLRFIKLQLPPHKFKVGDSVILSDGQSSVIEEIEQDGVLRVFCGDLEYNKKYKEIDWTKKVRRFLPSQVFPISARELLEANYWFSPTSSRRCLVKILDHIIALDLDTDQIEINIRNEWSTPYNPNSNLTISLARDTVRNHGEETYSSVGIFSNGRIILSALSSPSGEDDILKSPTGMVDTKTIIEKINAGLKIT